jgi:hypothetical protein
MLRLYNFPHQLILISFRHYKHPRLQLLALFKFIDFGEDDNIGWNKLNKLLQTKLLLKGQLEKTPPNCKGL